MARQDHDGAFLHNFDFDHFVKLYATSRPGEADSPYLGAPELEKDNWEWRRIFRFKNGDRVALCCPEDIKTSEQCVHEAEVVCHHCQVPICFDCWWCMCHAVQSRVPQALANDNFKGYAHPFIVANEVRWIEAAIACPLFTSMVVYYIEGVKEHLLNTKLGKQERTFAVRGEHLLLQDALGRRSRCTCTSW